MELALKTMHMTITTCIEVQNVLPLDNRNMLALMCGVHGGDSGYPRAISLSDYVVQCMRDIRSGVAALSSGSASAGVCA